MSLGSSGKRPLASPMLPGKRRVAVRFNQRNVARLKLPDGKTEHFEWDDELKRFGFRLRSEGARLSRTWVVQYRARGRTRRLKIGDAETLTAEQARAVAKVTLGKVDTGFDPQGDKQAQRLGAARTCAPWQIIIWR